MKKYVSGKISMRPEAEYRDEFGRGAALVLSLGDEPISPLEVVACETEDCNPGTHRPLSDGRYDHSWGCWIKYDIKMLLECGGIVMLPSWTTSPGAKFEKYVAEKCDLLVEYVSHDFKTLELRNER